MRWLGLQLLVPGDGGVGVGWDAAGCRLRLTLVANVSRVGIGSVGRYGGKETSRVGYVLC